MTSLQYMRTTYIMYTATVICYAIYNVEHSTDNIYYIWEILFLFLLIIRDFCSRQVVVLHNLNNQLSWNEWCVIFPLSALLKSVIATKLSENQQISIREKLFFNLLDEISDLPIYKIFHSCRYFRLLYSAVRNT